MSTDALADNVEVEAVRERKIKMLAKDPDQTSVGRKRYKQGGEERGSGCMYLFSLII